MKYKVMVSRDGMGIVASMDNKRKTIITSNISNTIFAGSTLHMSLTLLFR